MTNVQQVLVTTDRLGELLEGERLVITGKTKSGKTQTSIEVIKSLIEADKKVLVISDEDNYPFFLAGVYTTPQAFADAICFEEDEHRLFYNRSRFLTDYENLEAYIKKHNIDAVVMDGIVGGETATERNKFALNTLSNLAKSTNVLTVFSMQTKPVSVVYVIPNFMSGIVDKILYIQREYNVVSVQTFEVPNEK